MKFKTLLMTTLLLNSLATFAQQKAKPDTIFFEDFNEPTLNRDKWNVEVTGHTVNNEQQAYIDSAATVYLVKGTKAGGAKNGALVLKALYQPGYISKEQHKYDFLSGRINTRDKMEFTYGTASVRMKMV